ncbi:MAG: inositol monophosphatase [Deltaproteobacteria bacterium]|nr:inositol monophosphatase [Deltaproteobacteria bacterium]
MNERYQEFLNAAWQAAQAAGALIRQTWQETKQIDYKSAIDLVTSVDRHSEERIVQILRTRFPDHSILAEEQTDIVQNQQSYRWIIDPLDGTTNFAHAYPHFCVSIALEREGEVVLGLVYDPLREEIFRAAKEQGAVLNGKPIHTSAVTELDKALLATGFPYDRRERADLYLAYFKAYMVRCQGIRRNGSAALDLCYLACARIDGFWEFKLHAWDTAAASLIAREAGANITDLSGNDFSIWGDEILGSNGIIHSEMLEVAGQVK